jgi:hypothetical protein
LCNTWGVDQASILPTATRFFNDYKKLSSTTKKQDQQILNLQMKYLLKDDNKVFYVRSEHPDPTLYFSFLPQFAEEMQKLGKGVVFLGGNFALGLLGNP